jgi:DMSO/TMAO reductase YedYZ heme-binding membrane subunit
MILKKGKAFLMKGCVNMAYLGNTGAGCGGPIAPIMKACSSHGFLLLLLLFVLLASCTTRGIEKNYIFIIILAIIAFGGFSKTFGFGGDY